MAGSWFASSSSSSTRTHYDTLNVKRDATMEDIKAKFRKLSLETHPDTATTNSSNSSNNNRDCEKTAAALKRENAERFKQISHAASILTNKAKREVYDLQLERQRFTPNNILNDQHHRRNGSNHFHGARAGGQRATTGFQIFLETVFRPRNMVLGSVAIYAFVTYFSAVNKDKKRIGRPAEKVQAWKNPQTGQWEQPAPWDPIYRQLKPKLELIPREQVKSRRR